MVKISDYERKYGASNDAKSVTLNTLISPAGIQEKNKVDVRPEMVQADFDKENANKIANHLNSIADSFMKMQLKSDAAEADGLSNEMIQKMQEMLAKEIKDKQGRKAKDLPETVNSNLEKIYNEYIGKVPSSQIDSFNKSYNNYKTSKHGQLSMYSLEQLEIASNVEYDTKQKLIVEDVDYNSITDSTIVNINDQIKFNSKNRLNNKGLLTEDDNTNNEMIQEESSKYLTQATINIVNNRLSKKDYGTSRSVLKKANTIGNIDSKISNYLNEQIDKVEEEVLVYGVAEKAFTKSGGNLGIGYKYIDERGGSVSQKIMSKKVLDTLVDQENKAFESKIVTYSEDFRAGISRYNETGDLTDIINLSKATGDETIISAANYVSKNGLPTESNYYVMKGIASMTDTNSIKSMLFRNFDKLSKEDIEGIYNHIDRLQKINSSEKGSRDNLVKDLITKEGLKRGILKKDKDGLVTIVEGKEKEYITLTEDTYSFVHSQDSNMSNAAIETSYNISEAVTSIVEDEYEGIANTASRIMSGGNYNKLDEKSKKHISVKIAQAFKSDPNFWKNQDGQVRFLESLGVPKNKIDSFLEQSQYKIFKDMDNELFQKAVINVDSSFIPLKQEWEKKNKNKYGVIGLGVHGDYNSRMIGETYPSASTADYWKEYNRLKETLKIENKVPVSSGIEGVEEVTYEEFEGDDISLIYKENDSILNNTNVDYTIIDGSDSADDAIGSYIGSYTNNKSSLKLVDEHRYASTNVRDILEREKDTEDGWLGKVDLGNGDYATEYSIGVEIDNVEYQIPTLVPGLTDDQLSRLKQAIINNKTPDKDIIDTAVEFATDKIKSNNIDGIYKNGSYYSNYAKYISSMARTIHTLNPFNPKNKRFKFDNDTSLLEEFSSNKNDFYGLEYSGVSGMNVYSTIDGTVLDITDNGIVIKTKDDMFMTVFEGISPVEKHIYSKGDKIIFGDLLGVVNNNSLYYDIRVNVTGDWRSAAIGIK